MKLRERIKILFKKKFLHQTFFVYTGAMVNGLSLFVLNIFLTRVLDQQLFGVFSLVTMVLVTVTEMSDFGLNMGLLRFAPYYLTTNQEDKLKQLVKTIWRWRVILTVILTAAGVVLAYPVSVYVFGHAQLTPYLALTSFGIGGIILLGFLATFLQAKQRFFYYAALQSLKGFLRLIILVALFLFGVRSLSVYLLVYISVPWLLFLFNFNVLPKNFRYIEIDRETKKKLHSQLASFSFWLTLNSFLAIIASRIDQIIISRYLGLEKVAIFTVAWQLIQFFPIIYSSITSVLVPKISSLTTKSDLISFTKRSSKWVFTAAIGVGLCIYPSKYLIEFFFGAKYVEAIPVYLVLAYGYLLSVLVVPFSLVINVFNKVKFVTVSGVVHLVANVVGNIIFIPIYGIMGAAYTFAFSAAFIVFWNMAVAIYLIKKVDLVIEK